jgi:FkbM family methyltransferase
MSSETYTVDGHTFIPGLLKHGGWVIDAGCRGFNFSRALNELHCKVYAIDIDSVFKPEDIVYFHDFKQAALTTHSTQTEAYFFGNGTGNFIKGINELPGNTPDRPCETKIIPCITLDDIYNEIGTNIDLLKLDIEGSEYGVMDKMEPIPKQITVEFHQHCHPKQHEAYFNSIIERLSKYYHIHFFNVQHPYYFLDCLFIRKDIL